MDLDSCSILPFCYDFTKTIIDMRYFIIILSKFFCFGLAKTGGFDIKCMRKWHRVA